MSYLAAISTFTPLPFPLSYPIITPYWADVDTRGIGSVYYRETSIASVISTVASDVSNAFPSHSPFYATSVVIATWDRVGYFNEHTDKVIKKYLFYFYYSTHFRPIHFNVLLQLMAIDHMLSFFILIMVLNGPLVMLVEALMALEGHQHK